MRGLRNLGNTCYLNAALQCLLHVPGLTNYVLQGWAERDLAKRRVNACALAAAYVALVREYWTTEVHDRPLDPGPLLAALRKLHRPFASPAPNDAHEAVTMLLKHLHDALGRTPRIRPSPADAGVLREPWEQHLAKDGYSILTELFCGQSESLVADEAGRYSSTTHEHFVGLTLDLEGCSGVSQALAKAFAPTLIDDFALEPGGQRGAVTKITRLVHAPLILVLHLKRFGEDGSKVDRFVSYSTTLHVPGCGGHGAHYYDLFGVCMHADGHYRAACETRGTWRIMDDGAVAEIDLNSVITKEAYVLFYKKRL